MNRPVRKVAIFCLLLFAALLINANFIQVAEAGKLKKRTDNRREVLEKLDRERGQITTADGTVIAKSDAVADKYKYQRSYPTGMLYSAASGYYSLTYGTSAIERSQDSLLSGDDDRLFVSRLSDLVTGRKPKGGTVQLTLQARVQQAATTALGSNRGAVVALNPQTGAILALVTSPAYDPNPLASHNLATEKDAWSLVNQDPEPLLDRALQQTYPPGSTFKIVTTATALANGSAPDSQVDCPNTYTPPQTTSAIRNFDGETCGGSTTLSNAFTNSYNTAFAKLGVDLGATKLRDQAEKFGFGSGIAGFPLSMAKSVFPSSLDAPQTAQSAIGQYDVRVTPLQMAMVAAAVGNGGSLMKPYIVGDQLGPDLKSLGKTSPQVLGNPITSAVAGELRDMMVNVVNNGTGTPAQVPNVQVAGKTGTAQNANGAPPHAWFTGFAPADNPTVAVAVIVERSGGNNDGTGGAVAGPIARQVIEAALGQS